jgi:lipid-A-disaccharide synthase-like uncharacterized protein
MSFDPRSWDFWVLIGFVGQFVFAARFIVQWISSERRKVSHIPVEFWYFSLIGGSVMTVYAVHRRDPVFFVGQASGLIVYVRNLMLIRKEPVESRPTAEG